MIGSGQSSSARDRKKRLTLTTIVVIVLVASAAYFYQTNSRSRLTAVEVRKYERQNLSSIYDFRENSIKGSQHLDAESYKLTVTGLVYNPMELAYTEVIATYPFYEKVVTLYCVEGWDVTLLWEGVLVKDLLETAQVDPVATIVIFYAFDGYSTSLPLDYLLENDIVMAYKMNGAELPPERGFPFQLVAESKLGISG